MSKEFNFVGATQLPLDIRGTAFQRRVWQTLCQIPAGTTVTYSEIAKRIGRPKASHAVAAACAANKIGVAIPCHRVVRKTVRLLAIAGALSASALSLLWKPSDEQPRGN